MFNSKMITVLDILINLTKSIKKYFETQDIVNKYEDTEEKKEINAVIGEI